MDHSPHHRTSPRVRHCRCLYVTALLSPYLFVLNYGLYVFIIQNYLANEFTNPLISPAEVAIIEVASRIAYPAVGMSTLLLLLFGGWFWCMSWKANSVAADLPVEVKLNMVKVNEDIDANNNSGTVAQSAAV